MTCAFPTVSMLVNSPCSLPISAVWSNCSCQAITAYGTLSLFCIPVPFFNSFFSLNSSSKKLKCKKVLIFKSKWDRLSAAFRFLSDPFCGSVNFSYECGSNLDILLYLPKSAGSFKLKKTGIFRILVYHVRPLEVSAGESKLGLREQPAEVGL